MAPPPQGPCPWTRPTQGEVLGVATGRWRPQTRSPCPPTAVRSRPSTSGDAVPSPLPGAHGPLDPDNMDG